jgi:acetylornithine deacetylase/succinyl-diaminopimelate desuccinylase-like protein
VVNPLNEITRILGQIHDEDGRVRFDGFYDGVKPPTARETAAWAGLDFDEAAFLAGAGLETSVGEAGFSPLERIWSRPTCDINGLWGGYIGTGSKTVIPAQATVKLSCRLVAGQDPQGIRRSIKAFFEARTPPDCRWTFQYFSAAPAIEVSADSPWLTAVQAALEDVYGKPPVLTGSGGSIPVVGHIRNILGFESLLVGFGLDDDLIHSPNEKFELKCFHNGIRSHAAILSRFAAL